MAATAAAAAAAATVITSTVGYLAPRAAAHAQLAVINHTAKTVNVQASEIFGAHAGAVIGPMAGAVAGLSPKNMFVARVVGQATQLGVGLAATGAATALNQKAAAASPQPAEMPETVTVDGNDLNVFIRKEKKEEPQPSSMLQAAKGAALLGFAFLAPAAAAPIMPYLGVVDAAQRFITTYQENKTPQPGKSTDPEALVAAEKLLKGLSPEELAAATRILVDATQLAAQSATDKNSLWGALGEVAQAATIAGISNGVGAWVQLKEIDLAYDATVYGAGKAAEVPTSWLIGSGYISSAMERVGRFFGHLEGAKVALSEDNLKLAAHAGQLAEKGTSCLLAEGVNLVNKPSSKEAAGYGATAWKAAKYAGFIAAFVPAVYISPAAAGVAAGFQLAGYLPGLVMKNEKLESLKSAAQKLNELALDQLVEKEFVLIDPKEEKKPEPQINQEKVDEAVKALFKIAPRELAQLLNQAFEPEAAEEAKEQDPSPIEEPAPRAQAKEQEEKSLNAAV